MGPGPSESNEVSLAAGEMWTLHLLKALPAGFQYGMQYFSNLKLLLYDLFLEECEQMFPNMRHQQQTEGKISLKSRVDQGVYEGFLTGV